jgi:hypothetical protein
MPCTKEWKKRMKGMFEHNVEGGRKVVIGRADG